MRPHPYPVVDDASIQLIFILNTILVNFRFEYIDCWADHRDDDCTIIPDKNRFPE